MAKQMSEKKVEQKILIWRKMDGTKMETACRRVIDVLRNELNLEPYEAYFVVETLFKQFPKETLVQSVGNQQSKMDVPK